jgi:site-specific recombinase XerD
MTYHHRLTGADLAQLLGSFTLHLRAERKSPQTVKTYGDGVRAFLSWCEREGIEPALDRPTVDKFTAGLLDAGAEPSTARSRQLAVRRFSAWLASEDEIAGDQLVRLAPPKLDIKAIQPLIDDELRALLAACRGPDLRDKRDEAIIRLMIETGARAGEVIDMAVADVDLSAGTAVIRRGKGGKARSVPFGPRTGSAIDRYLRARRRHRLAGSEALWLGQGGKAFGYYALRDTLAYRAARAGIRNVHPHMFRHTAAHRWLSAGGSEGGLMAVAGWSRPDMLLRYTRARAEQRAAEEAKRLHLGDL